MHGHCRDRRNGTFLFFRFTLIKLPQGTRRDHMLRPSLAVITVIVISRATGSKRHHAIVTRFRVIVHDDRLSKSTSIFVQLVLFSATVKVATGEMGSDGHAVR
jgi:hypothetical protein